MNTSHNNFDNSFSVFLIFLDWRMEVILSSSLYRMCNKLSTAGKYIVVTDFNDNSFTLFVWVLFLT